MGETKVEKWAKRRLNSGGDEDGETKDEKWAGFKKSGGWDQKIRVAGEY